MQRPIEEPMDCGRLMKQISDKMEKHANERLGGLGVTFMQLHMLATIFFLGEEAIPLKTLERHFNVAQSTAAGIIVRLEKKGLIESFVPAEDKRLKMVRLTKAGEEILEQAHERQKEGNTILLANLAEEERVEFFRLLCKIYEGLN